MSRPSRCVPVVTANHVVVFEEKHCTRYFGGASGFLPIARKVFDERDSDPYWGYLKEAPACPQEPPEPPEGIDPELRALAMARSLKFKKRLCTYEELRTEFELLTRARAGDDQAAAEFILSRQDREYEGFEVERLETPVIAREGANGVVLKTRARGFTLDAPPPLPRPVSAERVVESLRAHPMIARKVAKQLIVLDPWVSLDGGYFGRFDPSDLLVARLTPNLTGFHLDILQRRGVEVGFPLHTTDPEEAKRVADRILRERDIVLLERYP